MKKKWNKLALEILDINMTMAGPGLKTPDEFNDDPDHEEADHYS